MDYGVDVARVGRARVVTRTAGSIGESGRHLLQDDLIRPIADIFFCKRSKFRVVNDPLKLRGVGQRHRQRPSKRSFDQLPPSASALAEFNTFFGWIHARFRRCRSALPGVTTAPDPAPAPWPLHAPRHRRQRRLPPADFGHRCRRERHRRGPGGTQRTAKLRGRRRRRTCSFPAPELHQQAARHQLRPDSVRFFQPRASAWAGHRSDPGSRDRAISTTSLNDRARGPAAGRSRTEAGSWQRLRRPQAATPSTPVGDYVNDQINYFTPRRAAVTTKEVTNVDPTSVRAVTSGSGCDARLLKCRTRHPRRRVRSPSASPTQPWRKPGPRFPERVQRLSRQGHESATAGKKAGRRCPRGSQDGRQECGAPKPKVKKEKTVSSKDSQQSNGNDSGKSGRFKHDKK